MNYLIRSIEKNDLDQFVNLCSEHAEYEGYSYNKKNKKDALQSQIFSSNPEVQCQVVESDQKLVGYASFLPQYSTWEARYYLYMDCLYLKEKFRGIGIGRELLSIIKKHALDHNFSEIQWQTPNTNRRAIEFYKREGASYMDKVRFFYDHKTESSFHKKLLLN